MTGPSHAALAPLDDLMRSFIQERGIPGAALAVTRNGKLVHARGYGWSDRDGRQRVEPDSLFRIASLSKQVTAVAVLQLVQRGQLSLDTRIYDLLDLDAYADDGHVDPRLKRVTVLQLLQHTAGFDRDVSFDPMFRSVQIAEHFGLLPPAKARDVIRYMTCRPLDFDPGGRYAYSNLGYCMLGRAIETVSGIPYGEYVHRNVLEPLGIHRMRLGQTLPEGRAPGEVHYYAGDRREPAVVGPVGEKVPLPYGAWYLEAMDSHGGWISSAVEMVRFAAALDDPRHCPLLSADSVRTMFARPEGPPGHDQQGGPKPTYYGCGWNVRPVGDGTANEWHTGSLDGTAALMVRRHDGLNWVVLFNTRSGPDGEHLGRAIDRPLHEAVDRVKHWPAHDLFPKFGLVPAVR